MAFKKIQSIAIAWRTKQGDVDGVIYDATELGEGVARQRSESRRALVEAAGHTVTDHRHSFTDGSNISML